MLTVIKITPIKFENCTVPCSQCMGQYAHLYDNSELSSQRKITYSCHNLNDYKTRPYILLSGY